MKFARSTTSEAETMILAERIASLLRPGDIVALEGALGAGKTVFVRGLARGLGIREGDVASPTFVLCREYEGRSGTRLAHIDAYRLSGDEELESFHWSDLLDAEDVIIAVEWSDRVEASLPPGRTIRIRIDHAGDSQRRLHFAIPETEAGRFESLKPRTRPCPSCGTPVALDEPEFPFCSERCRMADLNAWFSEKHRVSRPIEESDEFSD